MEKFHIEKKVRESYIEKKVCDYAKSLGCYVRKFISSAHRSVPDRLFITPKGVAFFIEFKAPGKKPSSLQIIEIDTIKTYYIAVYVVDNVEQGKDIIDEMMKVEVFNES